MKKTILKNRIPVSLSLSPILEAEHFEPPKNQNKKRILTISLIAFLIALGMSFIAKGLVYLINFITNFSFYGNFSIGHSSPADNSLGIFVIFIPALGGI